MSEEALGELTLPDQEKPMTLSAVRVGAFEAADYQAGGGAAGARRFIRRKYLATAIGPRGM